MIKQWGDVPRAVLRFVDDSTREWIGWSLPPVERAIEESGWVPDSAALWCRRCGMSIGIGEGTATGCGSCRGGAALGDGVIRISAYREPLRTWVHRVKYGGWEEMGTALGRRLGRQIGDVVDDLDRAVIVPVPMAWAKRVYRGVDHARVIADGVGMELGRPVHAVLTRSLGQGQVERTRTARRHARLGIRLRRRGVRRLRGLDVILVDDVLTTGGTLRASIRAVRAAGAGRVFAGVLAVTSDPARQTGIRR